MSDETAVRDDAPSDATADTATADSSLRARARRLLADPQAMREAAARLTTPLLPDDYFSLINPLWSARELRGRIEEVVPETEDAATLVIRPGWGWSFNHSPGQYVGIGIEVDGRWNWRSYSLTSPPQHSKGHISITVKAMPEGKLSEHLVRGVAPGTIVRLARPQGSFVLPEPPPASMLFVTAGSGVTPVMGMLRTLDRRGTMPDVVIIHSGRNPDQLLFRGELEALAEKYEQVTLHTRFTERDGRFSFAELTELCGDWKQREAWACGPEEMLDAAEKHFKQAGRKEALHTERFAAKLDGEAEGGHVTFTVSGKDVDVDGATTLLEAGEKAGITMPFGCRMGICHTCVVPLKSGTVVDLRNGTRSNKNSDTIQTCVSAAAGDCEIDV